MRKQIKVGDKVRVNRSDVCGSVDKIDNELGIHVCFNVSPEKCFLSAWLDESELEII